MPAPIRALLVFGTRPEGIKMAPVYQALQSDPRFTAQCCITAQHRSMLDSVLEVFRITPDYDLNAMRPNQSLPSLTARLIEGLDPVLAQAQPHVVLVQGDTTTTFAGALAAFYRQVPVAHVEAGLRTGDIYQPFPEEMNRLLVGRIARFHFAPTADSAANLHREAISLDRIWVTGNTGIDAVLSVASRLESGQLTPDPQIPVDPHKKAVLVTCHRRENFGPPLLAICQGLLTLAARPDVEIFFPVHRNPNVLDLVTRHLSGHPNIHLLEPLSYLPFVDLMRRSHLLITDSGGVQEEGPSLGKPILVLREKTERPEAVSAGTVKLVGTDPDLIVHAATLLLDDPAAYSNMTRRYNPYGDGTASTRIANLLAQHL